jgi:hypothetical protein
MTVLAEARSNLPDPTQPDLTRFKAARNSVRVLRERNKVMSPAEPKTKKSYAAEGQQKVSMRILLLEICRRFAGKYFIYLQG